MKLDGQVLLGIIIILIWAIAIISICGYKIPTNKIEGADAKAISELLDLQFNCYFYNEVTV